MLLLTLKFNLLNSVCTSTYWSAVREGLYSEVVLGSSCACLKIQGVNVHVKITQLE